MKWYFYIDWGSGYSLVNASDLKGFTLKLKRGEINDFAQRKKCEGAFSLSDSDFTDADTFFVTNGNFEAPLRIYENGDSGTGVLQYEGWIRKTGAFDYVEEKAQVSTFRTNDQYEELLSSINNKSIGSDITQYNVISGDFAAQGQDASASKLHRFTFSSPNFTLVGSLNIPNLGRCSTTWESNEFVVYDNVNDTLKGYTVSGSSWVETRTRTLGRFCVNGSVAGIGSNQVRLVYDNGISDVYQFSAATFTLVLPSQVNVGNLKNPKVADSLGVSESYVFTDEATNTLQTLSGRFSISTGNVINPDVCVLNATTNTFAFIDASQQKLMAYTLSTTGFSELGSLQLNGLVAPSIHYYLDDAIILHDTISGLLQRYDYALNTFTQTGNNYSLSGGYVSSVTVSNDAAREIMIAVSDTFSFKGSISHSYYSLINGLLYNNGIDILGSGYELEPGTTSGGGVNVDDFIIGDMSDVSWNEIDSSDTNYYKYTLSECLKYYELFQNYWYVDNNLKIKFTTPGLFSSFGTSYDISSLNAAAQLNQRTYRDEFQIDKEELSFLNARTSDFTENYIEYDRNTPVIQSSEFNYTTDLDFLIEVYTGQNNTEIDSAGLILHIIDRALSSSNTCASGTGIISGSDIKNYLLSQSQIYNDYWKDYRYQEQGDITINGISSPVQNTCRNIIEFPEIRLSYEELGITEFPDSVANLTWDAGVVSFITEFSVDLGTNEIVINSRLLDL